MAEKLAAIVTPCHGLPPLFHYGDEDKPYAQERVVDGIEFPAPRCYNVWTAEGEPDD